MNVKLSGIIEIHTILVSLMKVSNQYAILCSSYGSLNVQNRICELGTFSQMQSHMSSNLLALTYCILQESMAC